MWILSLFVGWVGGKAENLSTERTSVVSSPSFASSDWHVTVSVSPECAIATVRLLFEGFHIQGQRLLRHQSDDLHAAGLDSLIINYLIAVWPCLIIHNLIEFNIILIYDILFYFILAPVACGVKARLPLSRVFLLLYDPPITAEQNMPREISWGPCFWEDPRLSYPSPIPRGFPS